MKAGCPRDLNSAISLAWSKLARSTTKKGKETYVLKKKVASGNTEQNGRGERNKGTFEFPLRGLEAQSRSSLCVKIANLST